MERLTRRINGVVVYVGAKNPYSTGQIPCEVEPAGVREMMDRLAAYEDTGCAPEEVLPKDKADEIALKLMRLADLESLCSYTRLHELAEADKDGRVVVLPCKVGDMLCEVTGRKTISVYKVRAIRVELFGLFIEWDIDTTPFCSYVESSIGKTIFLTREKAEKALEAMTK